MKRQVCFNPRCYGRLAGKWVFCGPCTLMLRVGLIGGAAIITTVFVYSCCAGR